MNSPLSFYGQRENDMLHAIERFELVAKATHDVIWDWDLVTNAVWWSYGMTENFGYAPEVVGNGLDSWTSRVHPEDYERAVDSIHSVIGNDGANWSAFYRFRKADGSYAFVHDRGYTIQHGGKPVRMVGSMMDVTDQLRSEEQLQESRENLDFALRAARIGTWNLDPIHNTVTFDDRCMELYGYPSPEQMCYDQIMLLIHSEDRERVRQAVFCALDPNQRSGYNVRFRVEGAAKSSGLRWLHCQGQAYYGEDNVAYRFSGVSWDITQEVLSQEKALWADQRAAMTIEGSGAGSFLVDLKSDELIYSPTLARILTGREDFHVKRDTFVRHVHPEDILVRMHAYEIASRTGELKFECRFIWEDGSVHWVRVIGQNLKDAAGNDISLSGIVMDITDRIESEQRLRDSEEKYRLLALELEQRVKKRTEELHLANRALMASNNNLQQFAYAASHDMQEPLRKIISFSSRLHSAYSNNFDENGAFMLNRIQDASKRMSVMIDDLLAYSRLATQEDDFETVSLDEVTGNILADLEISIQEQNSDIIVDKLPQVWGNPFQLTQLFQNLLSNAIKYRRDDIPSRIAVRAAHAAPDEVGPHAQLMPGHNYVKIEVRDNGIGFNESYLERIFQMFQRLHGRSEFSGSGIGLALCKRVVQNHYGHITAYSKPGEGSTFVVFLPQPK